VVFIQRDLKQTSASCEDPKMPCNIGTPLVVLLPLSATAAGWVGATRPAAGREASIWRSPVFWAGTATELAAYVVWTLSSKQRTPDERLTWDTIFLTGAVLGTAMQVWGALVAPSNVIQHARPASSPPAPAVHAGSGTCRSSACTIQRQSSMCAAIGCALFRIVTSCQ
jgi:hypothetical protein